MIIASDDKKNILLCNRIAQYIGNISYSLYLYHWPVIVAFKYITLKNFFSFNDVISIFLITLILSHLSYKFIELNFKSSKIRKKNNFIVIFIFLVTSFYSYSFVQHNKINEKKNDFLKLSPSRLRRPVFLIYYIKNSKCIDNTVLSDFKVRIADKNSWALYAKN